MIKKEITNPALLEQFKTIHKDGMTVFILGDGDVRGALFHGTRFVNQMRIQHNLGILESLALGHASLCAGLLIPMMKGRERIVFRYDTDGAFSGFSVEAFSEGFVRGYLSNDTIPINEELKSWSLKPFIGDGQVSLIRFPEGAKEPMTGITKIKHKNISLDLSEYFLQSEQTITGFNTGIKFDKAGNIIGAGGAYIQVMPDADEEILSLAERAFSASPSFGQWFAEGGDFEDVIFGLFRECNPQILVERDIKFDCPCSAEYFKQSLSLLSKEELTEMYKEGNGSIELKCHNCNSIYTVEME